MKGARTAKLELLTPPKVGWKNCSALHFTDEGDFSGGFSSRDLGQWRGGIGTVFGSVRCPALSGVWCNRLFVLIAAILR